jgi:hypothetical protein
MTVCETQGMRRAALVVAAVSLMLVGSAIARAAQATTTTAKVDVTGVWIFAVETEGGSGTPTVTFKQDGEKITGHYSSATFGEVDLTGTLKDQDLGFKFGAADVGEVTYKGTVQSNNAIKGTLDIPGIGAGTFTAKRKE